MSVVAFHLLVPLLTVCGVVFDAQELPELQAGAPGRITAARSVNYLHADLDGDGAADLVMANAVYFQRNQRFPLTARVMLPEAVENASLDVWGATLYLKDAAAIRMITWANGAWETVLHAPLPETGSTGASESSRGLRRAAPELFRFLYDLDDDGIPEVVEPTTEGLRVLRLDGGTCRLAGLLRVLPPLRIAGAPAPTLWPEARRRIRMPVRYATCTLYVDKNAVVVLERVQGTKRDTHYRKLTYDIHSHPEGDFSVDASPRVENLPPVPATSAPCRLNGDTIIDYAGVVFEDAGVLPVRVPAYTVSVSLDGGKSFVHRRGQAPYPQPPFIDFDGDGDLDLVTEETDLYKDGLWQWVTRMTTRARLRHVVRIYPQVQGHFTNTPAAEAIVEVTLPAPPRFDQELYDAYQGIGALGLITLTGDYNGDGYKDLLVQDRAGCLAVFLAAGFGFADQPDVRIEAPGLRGFSAADVNGDGRDDIVVQRVLADAESNAPAMRTFVYFSREGAS